MDIRGGFTGALRAVRGFFSGALRAAAGFFRGLTGLRRVLFIVVSAAVVAALVIFGCVYWFAPVTIEGMDASHYQGAISWKAVRKSSSVRFVYLKATEGSDYTDARFASNLAGAKAAGLKVGAYHYFTTTSTGEAQAQHFIATVSKTSGMLAPAVDIEIAVTKEDDFKQQVADYVKLIEAHYGQKPVFYVPSKVYNLLYDTYSDYPFWVISLKTTPTVSGWTFWQYSNSATLPGVDGKIDLDCFQGSRFDFHKLLS